jgi:hypothetical protein
MIMLLRFTPTHGVGVAFDKSFIGTNRSIAAEMKRRGSVALPVTTSVDGNFSDTTATSNRCFLLPFYNSVSGSDKNISLVQFIN